MSHRTREIRYLECDGCGYDVSEAEATTLTLTVRSSVTKGKYTIPFHFHPVSSDQDCLRYFILNRYVIERQLAELDSPVLTNEIRDLILNRIPLQTTK